MMWQWLLQPRVRIAWWFAVFLVAVLILRLLTDPARSEATEPGWYKDSHECTAQIAKQLGGCGSCSAQWREISKCTIKRISPQIDWVKNAWILDACVTAVDSRLPAGLPGSTDRITPMVQCATGHK